MLPCSSGSLLWKSRRSVRSWLASAAGSKMRRFNSIVSSFDSNLAQALLGRDDPMLREVLASSIAQLEEALRRSRAEAACPAWPPKGSRVSKVLTVVHRARPAAL